MKGNSPLVTVGIPTYNRPLGLESTLKCILDQTYTNLEIIVSDNCSDNMEVLPILEKYAARDRRVRYVVQKKNLSIIPNFQFLLDQAKGDFFMWAADDDSWDPNFIEVCVQGLNGNPDVVLAMADLKLIGTDGKVRNSRLNRGFMQKDLLLRCFQLVKSTSDNKYFFCGLYRTSCIKNIPFHNSWGGDHMFIYEALTKGKFLYLKDKANFYYFQGGNSKGMDTVRKAFNIKSRFYFFEAYNLRYATYQFQFKHITFIQKLGLFFFNSAGLVFNEDFMLYYIFIKKPIKNLINTFKKKPVEYI